MVAAEYYCVCILVMNYVFVHEYYVHVAMVKIATFCTAVLMNDVMVVWEVTG